MTMDRIAAAMGCAPADEDDLVEAVRLLVAERDAAGAGAEREGVSEAEWWQAECARLRADLEATERARQAAEEERDAALELVAPGAVEAALASLRVALADNDLILEERERQLTAALAAVAAERARCAAVCREVAGFYDADDVGGVVAHACADEIEREEASATRSADAAVDAVRELGHVAAAAVARADSAEARLTALAGAVRAERAATAAHDLAWAAHIAADDLAGAEEVLALDARLDAARAALDAALGAT